MYRGQRELIVLLQNKNPDICKIRCKYTKRRRLCAGPGGQGTGGRARGREGGQGTEMLRDLPGLTQRPGLPGKVSLNVLSEFRGNDYLANIYKTTSAAVPTAARRPSRASGGPGVRCGCEFQWGDRGWGGGGGVCPQCHRATHWAVRIRNWSWGGGQPAQRSGRQACWVPVPP